MEVQHNAKLTATELSQIWAAYQNDTMSICALQYFLQTVEDDDIRSIIQQTLDAAQSHIPKLTTFFTEENWPVPQGFTEADVNLSAPRLFSDTFMLYYIQQMGMLGINAYSMAISLSVRQDVYEYFSQCMIEYMDIHKKGTQLLLEKGLYIRAPYLAPPESIDFVNDTKFLGGWFGENRPLLSLEIANLYSNIQRNALGSALMIAFSQVAGTEEIRKYMIKGKNMATKHVEVFGSLLTKDDLPSPVTWDSEVTQSTVSPFSDKLMMFHTTALISIGMGYYGTALSTCLRKDVSTDYARLIAEIGKYSLEGAKIMISHSWLEEPPKAANRDELAKNKA